MPYKLHTFNELLKYMHLLEEGYSARYVEKHYGINQRRVRYLWESYKRLGEAALVRKINIRADGALKEKVVRDYLENHLSLTEITLKYDVCDYSIVAWSKVVKKQGYEALYATKSRGRKPKDMTGQKKSITESELDKLRKEVNKLRAENALLKKVKALVELRDTQLREIGRKPSRN